MFDGAKVLLTGEKYESEAFFEYIANVLGGHIDQGYENPYGEGRIVSVNPES